MPLVSPSGWPRDNLFHRCVVDLVPGSPAMRAVFFNTPIEIFYAKSKPQRTLTRALCARPHCVLFMRFVLKRTRPNGQLVCSAKDGHPQLLIPVNALAAALFIRGARLCESCTVFDGCLCKRIHRNHGSSMERVFPAVIGTNINVVIIRIIPNYASRVTSWISARTLETAVGAE